MPFGRRCLASCILLVSGSAAFLVPTPALLGIPTLKGLASVSLGKKGSLPSHRAFSVLTTMNIFRNFASGAMGGRGAGTAVPWKGEAGGGSLFKNTLTVPTWDKLKEQVSARCGACNFTLTLWVSSGIAFVANTKHLFRNP